ncbi:MAG: HAD-IIB family hydrolase [Planctomycetes bacterium]|nr:HAD-IIB family hydrolase [Planctomycetota bacterium]
MKGLIAVDLDGTLLDAKGTVSARNKEALANLQAAGYEVVPATGRSWRESRRVFEAIQTQGLAITSGGSVLSDAATGTTLERSTIEADLARQLAAEVIERGLLAHLLCDHAASSHDYCLIGTGAIDPATQWWLESHNVPVRRAADLGEAEAHGFDHVLRVGAVDRGDLLEPVCTSMREKFRGRATMQSWSAVTATAAIGSETHLLEIYSLDTDKWTMLRKLRDRRGLGNERVYAIGDGLNDLIMVREAGVGIAMGNAHAHVHKHAKHIAPHHGEDGFAHAAERILSGAFTSEAVRSAS